MVWLPKCEKLERVVGGHNWLDTMIVYFDKYAYEHREFTRRLIGLIGEINEACADTMAFVQELRSVVGDLSTIVRSKLDDIRLVRKINALCDTLPTVIDERWPFITKLEVLSYKFMPGNMVEFMKEIQEKDVSNLMKLRILGKEFELRDRKKDIFI
nr:hypothetical protein [Tanacetum cinerariifolium]